MLHRHGWWSTLGGVGGLCGRWSLFCWENDLFGWHGMAGEFAGVVQHGHLLDTCAGVCVCQALIPIDREVGSMPCLRDAQVVGPTSCAGLATRRPAARGKCVGSMERLGRGCARRIGVSGMCGAQMWVFVPRMDAAPAPGFLTPFSVGRLATPTQIRQPPPGRTHANPARPHPRQIRTKSPATLLSPG